MDHLQFVQKPQTTTWNVYNLVNNGEQLPIPENPNPFLEVYSGLKIPSSGYLRIVLDS